LNAQEKQQSITLHTAMPVLSSSPSSWSSRVALLSCILVVTTSNIFGTVRVAFAQKDNSKKDNNNNGNSNSLSCMDREATSCRECLATTDNSDRDSPACGWVPGYGCLDSCSVIADVACYSVASTTVTSSSSTSSSSAGVSTSNFDSNLEAAAASSFVDWAEPVCAIADADEADQALCASKLDCASCVATALSAAAESPNNYCQWFGSELMGGDSTDGIGWCGNACTMIGCGETTCAIAGEGQDGVGDNDNDNDNNNDNDASTRSPVGIVVIDAGANGVDVDDGVTELPVDFNGGDTTAASADVDAGKEVPPLPVETEDTPLDNAQGEGENTTTTNTNTTTTKPPKKSKPSPTTNEVNSDENLFSPASNRNIVGGSSTGILLLLLVSLLGVSPFWAF